jgi:hypothetical protein
VKGVRLTHIGGPTLLVRGEALLRRVYEAFKCVEPTA